MRIQWDSVNEGDELPVIVKSPGVSDLVRFAAGNGDFNPLHHDYNNKMAKAIGSILVHGYYKYSVFGQLLSDWLGHSGKVQKISCQHTGMDFPDKEIRFCGKIDEKIEEKEKRILKLSMWTETSQGKKTAMGNAVLVMN